MRVVKRSASSGAADVEVAARLDWRRNTSTDGHDEILLRIDGAEVTPHQAQGAGLLIVAASPLERRLLRHGGYAALLAQ